jgi:hypothetical protein
MLNIATPRLSQEEWLPVQEALAAVADCGCGEGLGAGSRSRLARWIDALVGSKAEPAPALPEELRPMRDFLCETGRTGRLAERHVGTLHAQGFTRPQIEALALLGA